MTEEDIVRIIREENVRNYFNKENEKQPSKSYKFLNSAFGIWFLSTIVVGIITFGYSTYQNYLQKIDKKNNMINMIDVEIESRLYQFKYKSHRFNDSTQVNSYNDSGLDTHYDYETIKEYWFQIKQSPDQSYVGYYSVYTRFDDRNLISLLFELSSLVTDKNEKAEINEVIRKIISNEIVPINNSDVNEVTIDEIIKKIKIKRWSKIWSN